MTRRGIIETALRRLAPRIPSYEFSVIADQAMDSAGLRRATPEEAAWLSMVAYIRHVLTDYDALLDQGYDAASARHFVAADMESVLAAWGARRPLSSENE
jgi:hypothetical protein